jgi:UDP-N-acetylmuramate dehydrogenase
MVEVFTNYKIANESTFRIGGIVKQVAFPGSVDELIQLLKSKEYDVVLGNCSNVLFSSEFINQNIIITKNVDKFSFVNDELHVDCGVKGPIISKECQKNSITGFEFLIGFPGSFGGMICMNASAHNQAISDNFISARVFDRQNNEVVTFNKNEMNFEYRKSKLSSGDFIVLDAIFSTHKGNQEDINKLMERNTEFRKSRQPSLKYGNAGSIFKNPENDSAGRFLDLCEMKGQQEGGAIVFDKHANFILNYNNATSSDVLKLMYTMYSKVKENYTIELQPEIKYIGDKQTKEYKIWEMITKNIHKTQK